MEVWSFTVGLLIPLKKQKEGVTLRISKHFISQVILSCPLSSKGSPLLCVPKPRARQEVRAACPHPCHYPWVADKSYCLLPLVVVPAAAARSTSPQLRALFVCGTAQTIAQSLSVDDCNLKREILFSAFSHRPQGHRNSAAASL